MKIARRVNIAFSILEYQAIKREAIRAGFKKPGSYCRNLIIDRVGKIKPDIAGPGIEQINLFSRKKRITKKK